MVVENIVFNLPTFFELYFDLIVNSSLVINIAFSAQIFMINSLAVLIIFSFLTVFSILIVLVKHNFCKIILTCLNVKTFFSLPF